MKTIETQTGSEQPQYSLGDKVHNLTVPVSATAEDIEALHAELTKIQMVQSGRRGGRASDAAEIEKRCRENATNRIADAEKLAHMPARTEKPKEWNRKLYLMGVLGDATRAKANGDLTPDQFEAVKAGVFARAEHLTENARKAAARRALRRKK